jgi:predicted DCC family thiol-disulfide oxidoreductase YuxK
MGGGGPIVFYDGVCGLCNRSVQFILRRDKALVFRFAALQSDFAQKTVAAHGGDAANLDTMYTLDGGKLYMRSRAILQALKHLPRWRMFARIVGIFPTLLLDFFYRVVARTRYRIFGRLDACAVPRPEDRARFLA